jgi:CRISP-associated protein Cas1
MAWRGVHISQAAKIGLKQSQLLVAMNDNEVTIPIEDISFLVLDTPQCTLTGAVIAALANSNVVIIQSDDKHHPTMMGLPFHGHHKQAEIAHLQIAVTEPFKKRAWQAIIQAKISNQAAHLLSHGREVGALPAMITRVKSGDTQNHEAQAARIYWGKLFSAFRRADDNDLRNAMLNYGYAIVRALLARTITASGLIPAFGLFHNSISNAFNLADDLIEPFRPSVDALVFRLMKNCDGENELSLAHRRALVGIMNEPVRLGAEVMTLQAATEQCAQSLVSAMRQKNYEILKLPIFEIYPQAAAAA